MARHFNSAGPNDPADHYTRPPLPRLPDARHLIEEKRCFVLHAPAQSGKTTALLALARELTCEDRFAAVVLSVESGVPFSDEPGRAEDAILDEWQGAASRRLPAELRPPAWPAAPPGRRICRALQAWAEEAPRPLVVLIDDIDTLEGPALASVLRQIREGYPDWPHHFPWCVAVAGARDVPDYKIATGCSGHADTDGSFDIRSEALTLRDFTRDEVAALYRGHTEDTGQVFLPEAIDHVLYLTRGQPWLVSALARQIVEVLVPDRETAIDATHVDIAREILVRRQEPHFDRLGAHLREPRVRGILEPLLCSAPRGPVLDEDRRLVVDLGLLQGSGNGELAIANPIYREVLQRHLESSRRSSVPLLLPAAAPIEDVIDEASWEPAPRRPSAPAAATAWPPYRIERLSPEKLSESFELGCHVLPDAGDEAVPSPPRRSPFSLWIALVAAALWGFVALLAIRAGSSESPAAAPPSLPEPAAAALPAVVERADPPPAALPPETTAAPTAETAEPVPAKVRSAPRAPTPANAPHPPARPPKLDDADGLPESPRPVGRVVPALPPLQLDDGRMRRELEPRVWAGEASTEEIRMLKAICSDMGDHRCRDRARSMLEGRTQ